MPEEQVEQKIPLKNIYHLLSYAWNHLTAAGIAEVSASDDWDLLDLLGAVLARGVHHVLKSGLDRSYRLHSADTSALRGRINFGHSIKRLLLKKAQAHCEFDEFTHDILQNQIIKATIRQLTRSRLLTDKAIRSDLTQLLLRLADVADIRLSKQDFRKVQLHRNNAFYGFLLDVCALIYELQLVEETGSDGRFRDYLRDGAMWKLFQNFVFNFYRLRQTALTVSAKKIDWVATSIDERSAQLLPEMQTDITLRSTARIIIIDTKYYEKALGDYRGQRLNPSHLFQIYAYMTNMASAADPGQRVEGVLLYPAVSYKLKQEYTLKGHRLQVRTLDLAQDWRQIELDLLSVL